MYLERSKVM